MSSTFTDLKEERAEVLQAVWELDCIPTGMEAFLATNESQWEVIEKVIDECDYYILLIGARYGTVTKEGISYTEKEFNYAKAMGIPILAFVHGDPGSISVAKAEADKVAQELLNAFRDRVLVEYPVRRWTSPQELGGVVSRSLSRAIKVNPRPGWVRNTGSSNLELLEQINQLTKEIAVLRSQPRSETFNHANGKLQSGKDTINLTGTFRRYEREKGIGDAKNGDWAARASWDDILRDVGPILLNEASESDVKQKLAAFIGWSGEFDGDKFRYSSWSISSGSFAEVIVQFRALGLIQKGTRKRTVSDNANYWMLTSSGEQHLISLLAKKKNTVERQPPIDPGLQ